MVFEAKHEAPFSRLCLAFKAENGNSGITFPGMGGDDLLAAQDTGQCAHPAKKSLHGRGWDPVQG